jgi:tyrosyl-tRNA synthetase
MTLLDFIRDVGKHISVNYMMAKDSVKSRLETGMSFTEFSYQLVQGYDFYYLNKHKNCIVQLGGSDQWGNIVTGTELIRRKGGGEAYAVTTPLIKKADGTKFGKTEAGNVWLDAEKTSPYKFYQFWLNASDADAENYIKIFTLKDREEIETLIAEHKEAEHLRLLQKELAADITRRVHDEDALQSAIETSQALFSKSFDAIKNLSERDFLDVFEGVPQATVERDVISEGLGVIDALSAKTGFLGSNGEARRLLKSNAIAVNRTKVNDQFVITSDALIHDKYVLIGKGKKENYLLIVD